jgi:hypothetical protein
MIYKPDHSTSYENRLWLWFLIYLTFGGSALAACSESLIDKIGPQEVQIIQLKIEKSVSSHHANLNHVPDEIRKTSHEDLSSFKKYDLLIPIHRPYYLITDTYYGNEYRIITPDIYTLPRDPRILCLLAPGTVVFLSDEVTHHYAIVDDIDYQKEVVTLIDPWAGASFLLAGRNVLGVRARAYTGPKGQPFLDLTFAECLRVIHGTADRLT